MSSEKDKQISLDLKAGQTRTKPEASPVTDDSEILEWTCHPAKKNLKVTVAVSAFLIVMIAIVYYVTYSVWFMALGAAILFGSLASFYLPTRFRLTGEEITVKSTTQKGTKKWSQFRSYYPDKNGVLLSPFVRPTRLENFRGTYIRFSNNRDEVIDFVKNHIKKPEQED